MGDLLQFAGVIFLIAAWLIGIRYLRQSWPTVQRGMRNAHGRLDDEIGRAFPELQNEIRNIRRSIRNEISRIFPLFSAETSKGTEAEFIRDRLSEDFRFWVSVLAIVTLGGLALWLTR